MKNLSLALLVLVAAAIQAETPKNITVTTVDGKQAELTPAEVEKAYTQFLHLRGPSAKKIVRNEDNSITINEPFFRYNDQNLRYFVSSSNQFLNSLNGICRRFGQSVPHVFYVSEPIEKTEQMAFLDSNGNINSLVKPTEKDVADKLVEVIKSITCPAKQ